MRFASITQKEIPVLWRDFNVRKDFRDQTKPAMVCLQNTMYKMFGFNAICSQLVVSYNADAFATYWMAVFFPSHGITWISFKSLKDKLHTSAPPTKAGGKDKRAVNVHQKLRFTSKFAFVGVFVEGLYESRIYRAYLFSPVVRPRLPS